MTIEEALVAFLQSDAALRNLVAGRVYPDSAPQGAKFPHVTYTTIDTPEWYGLGGPTGTAYPRIQIDCWGSGRTGKADAVAVANAVRTAVGTGALKLDGFAGVLSGLRIKLIKLIDRRDLSDPPQHAEETPTRRRSLDFIVFFDEP